MTFVEFVKLVKNYEEELKNGIKYMEVINKFIIFNPECHSNIRERIMLDDHFKSRMVYLANKNPYLGKKFPSLINEVQSRSR